MYWQLVRWSSYASSTGSTPGRLPWSMKIFFSTMSVFSNHDLHNRASSGHIHVVELWTTVKWVCERFVLPLFQHDLLLSNWKQVCMASWLSCPSRPWRENLTKYWNESKSLRCHNPKTHIDGRCYERSHVMQQPLILLFIIEPSGRKQWNVMFKNTCPWSGIVYHSFWDNLGCVPERSHIFE